MKWLALVFSKDLNPTTIVNVNRNLTVILSVSRAVSHSRKSTVVLPNRQSITILIISYSWHFTTLHSSKSGPVAFNSLTAFNRSEFKLTSLFVNRLSCFRLGPFWAR